MTNQSYLKMSSLWRKWFPKALAAEVIEVFDTVAQLRKLGHNEEDDYDYLRIVDICDAFKGELFQRGIMFVSTDRERLFEKVGNSKGELIDRCTVSTDFAVIRNRERLELGSAMGSSKDHSDKALAIAQTAAFKAFLKRASMTYGQADDPETHRDSLTPKESVCVASYQRRALDAALRTSGISAAALSEELSKALGFEIGIDQIADLPRQEFDQAMKLILHHQDLSAQWSEAVTEIKARKPAVAAQENGQPITKVLDMPVRDEVDVAGD